VRLFLSGLFLLNWQTAIKINFAFEVGAAMADYIHRHWNNYYSSVSLYRRVSTVSLMKVLPLLVNE
jgi:hypothetical protein